MLDREQFLNDYIRLGAERKNKIHWHILISVYNTLISPITVVPYSVFRYRFQFLMIWFSGSVSCCLLCHSSCAHHFSFGFFSWRSANSPPIYSVGGFPQALASNLLPSRHWCTDGLRLSEQTDSARWSLFILVISHFFLRENRIVRSDFLAVVQILHPCLLGPMILPQ